MDNDNSQQCTAQGRCEMANSSDILYTGNETFGENEQRYGSKSYELIISVTLPITMILVMLSIGCTLEVKKLCGHIKRPWGITVGMICQFGLMPLLAWILLMNVSVEPIQALTIFFIGCCPGGAISNAVSFWIDADMDLSISVTVVSNMASLGTMPLFLFLFSSFWESEDSIEVPFKTIGAIFPGLLIPTACGIFVNYRWPKQSKIILKVGSIVGAILIPVLGILSFVLYEGSWDIGPSLLRVAAIFPLAGYLGGFLLARLSCQSWQRCRTISVGTGTQNMHLCVTALQVSFSPKHFGQILSFLIIYTVFQLLYLLGIVAAYQIYKKCLRKPAAEARPTDPDTKTSDNLHGEANLGFEKGEEQVVNFKMDRTSKMA